ncbi:MAG: MOP flippase family protein, partial [Chloroflexi bacterium]|nr:MOP flippase family protein [Chloroflexota bacterium]
MSVKQQTITGIAWSTIARVAQQGLQFLISVALARLLTPQDFGLVAMTAVFTGFAALFNELGFGAALIQHERIEERHLSSVFWLNVLAGFILMVLTIGAAPLIALLYDEPRLSLLTMLIATNFLFGSFGIVPNALMMRALNFRGLALIEAAATLLAGAVAIVLALMGYGVFALVWQMIISTIGRVVFLWYSSAWRPAFRFSWSAVRELLGFSTNLLGFSTFNYWVRKADDLLIGKFVGSAGLGVYTRAYSIMLLPLNQVSSVVSRVMFPTLSQIKDDRRRVKRIYLRSISIVALITFPMMLGLLVVSESFVLALYGLQWKEIIPLLRMLSLVGLAQSIGTTTGWIYQSQGRTDWMFRWGVASGIVTLISFAIGIRWGVLGVAIAYVVRTFALTYFNFSIPGRL